MERGPRWGAAHCPHLRCPRGGPTTPLDGRAWSDTSTGGLTPLVLWGERALPSVHVLGAASEMSCLVLGSQGDLRPLSVLSLDFGRKGA